MPPALISCGAPAPAPGARLCRGGSGAASGVVTVTSRSPYYGGSGKRSLLRRSAKQTAPVRRQSYFVAMTSPASSGAAGKSLPPPSRSRLRSFRVTELRKELQRLEKSPEGKKEDLVEALYRAFAEEGLMPSSEILGTGAGDETTISSKERGKFVDENGSAAEKHGSVESKGARPGVQQRARSPLHQKAAGSATPPQQPERPPMKRPSVVDARKCKPSEVSRTATRRPSIIKSPRSNVAKSSPRSASQPRPRPRPVHTSSQAPAQHGTGGPRTRHLPRRQQVMGNYPHTSAQAPDESFFESMCTGTDMQLIFLGTSSGCPTLVRNVTSICFRNDGRVWLFDVGEATQLQMMRARIKIGKLERIFITHLHGDHIFGLPGLVQWVSNAADKERQDRKPLHIYGPRGVADFIRVSLAVSRHRLHVKVYVHELVDESSNPGRTVKLAEGRSYGGLFGTEIETEYMGDTPFWKVCLDNEGARHGGRGESPSLMVVATPLQHSVECIGYVIREAPWPGRLDDAKCKALGLPPGPEYGELKNGRSVTLPDGRVIEPKDVVGPPRPGRKLVILGDTCNPSYIEPFGKEADLLVHEATFSSAQSNKAYRAKHSTAAMAGRFARRIQAKQLIITHFSGRYDTAAAPNEDMMYEVLHLTGA
eukprot:scaffold3199_cov402-Prasinococcus_capsulatus_cf.AAC.6